MACSCAITMLNPNLLFIIARRHMMQTWMSSVASPIFNFVECRSCLAIRGPSKSLLWWLVFLRELLPKRGFLDTDAEPFILILQSSLPELEPKKKYILHNILFFKRMFSKKWIWTFGHLLSLFLKRFCGGRLTFEKLINKNKRKSFYPFHHGLCWTLSSQNLNLKFKHRCSFASISTI